MKGFFDNFKKDSSVEKSKSIRCGGCGISCQLFATCKNSKMKAEGKGTKGIMLVLDFPSKTEDETGERFSGESGKFVVKAFAKYGLDLKKDCKSTYGVKCHPQNSRVPTKKEIDTCHFFLREEIMEYKPKVIFLLGEVALESFLKNRWKKDIGPIDRWRGLKIYDREYNCWVIATYSPLYMIKQKNNDILWSIFQDDIEKGMELLKKPVPVYEDEKQFIRIIESENLVLRLLERIRQKEKLIAIDFETTGLRPYIKGHEIISTAIACSEFACYSFINTPRINERLKAILKDGSIGKIASNIKYEHLWAREILGVEIQGWVWDTMLAAHILDNRTGISGLKFQTYINFGIIDYSSKIEEYLSSDGAEFNNIKKAPVKDLLLYNGLDSLFEFRLAMIQMEEINEAK